MTRLYLSGPVTGIKDDNRAAFNKEQRKLWSECGYIADIPHDFVNEGTPHDEAMAILLNRLTARTYSYRKWKHANLYDGVALLPGWEQSEGARLEKAVSEACGIPCKTVDEWIEEAR